MVIYDYDFTNKYFVSINEYLLYLLEQLNFFFPFFL